jgi:hypothetical protein
LRIHALPEEKNHSTLKGYQHPALKEDRVREGVGNTPTFQGRWHDKKNLLKKLLNVMIQKRISDT